jgi:hypothetical protein
MSEDAKQPKTPVVFVSDASAEVARIADSLRGAGYVVVDVPLSMLVARVSVQKPQVVLLDADATDALDVVLKARRVPGAGGIDFVYLGSGEGSVRSSDEALAHEGSAFFARPVDVGALLRKVESLTGGPAANEARTSTPPPSLPRSRPPSGVPPERPSSPSLPAPGVRTPGPPLPMSSPSLVDLIEPPRSLSSFGTVSSELQQLLADAEMRAEIMSTPDALLPSPEEEIETVLPADVLASLDEPIDADDDEDAAAADAAPRAAGDRDAPGKPTTSGGSRAPTTGGGRASSQTQERVASEAPSPRSTDTGQQASGLTPRGTPFPPTLTAASPASLSPSELRGPSVSPAVPTTVLGTGEARRFVADAIAKRMTGALYVEHEGVARRIVLRDGDLVTAASSHDKETLVHFLGARGELPRDEVDRLAPKVPPYGRHAGAALVARGFLRQDQLWDVLRGHAEWIARAVLCLPRATVQLEPDPPGRLRSEPSVFGAATGAEIFVELVRRVIAPEEALEAIGGEGTRIADGAHQALLTECALPHAEIDLLTRMRGGTVAEVLARATDTEIAAVLHALSLLGVLELVPAPDFAQSKGLSASAGDLALDDEAIRARVRARLELVDEGDYFAVLGISRDATSYEVRRAFVDLRRTFEPSRILSPRLADLAEDVRKIAVVLEEAYEILRDAPRRERYRRAIEARPES